MILPLEINNVNARQRTDFGFRLQNVDNALLITLKQGSRPG